jgi:galactokinase
LLSNNWHGEATVNHPDFRMLFDHSPEATGRSRGRVNLIGEHTDYNGGYVLPMPTPFYTQVEGSARRDRLIKVFSTHGDDSLVIYELGSEKTTGTWLDYIQGLTWVLGQKTEMLAGANLRIESDIPMGSGLSSSAALGVAVLRTLQKLFDFRFTDLDLAMMCRESENRFVGAMVGIMDPIACLLARDQHALFIDTMTLTMRHIPLPPQLGFIVIDTGVAHQVRGEGYNERRKECEQACAILGVRALRDIQDRPHVLELLPEKLRKRARHVILENQRVLDLIHAIEGGNFEETGRLFYASHASMRDDYEVSLPDIDHLVEICGKNPSIYGARLTGGGFGGAVVIAAKPENLSQTAARIASLYRSLTGKAARIWLPQNVQYSSETEE